MFKTGAFSKLCQVSVRIHRHYDQIGTPYNLLDAPSLRYTVQMGARLGYGPHIEPAPRRGLAAQIVKS